MSGVKGSLCTCTYKADEKVPRFDGRDPLGWIFNISQFFDYQSTPEEEGITLASFYLDGPALSWFQNYKQKKVHNFYSLVQLLVCSVSAAY